MADTVLAARAISKSYGSFEAVHELSFQARAGEVVGLLGPNGAGKTTAIRVLTTILSPSSGTFEIAGVPNDRPAEIRRRVGVLPENAGYPEAMTGARYIRYYTRLFGFPAGVADQRVKTLLEEVGLSERASGRIGTYSRGMRQRLGIARALVNQPQVVFLDEPTLGLDPAGQRQVLRLIQRIAQERGTTVVLSTHFLDEVEEVCSRIVILNKARVIVQGSVDEVKGELAVPRSARIEVPAERQSAALAALGEAGISGVQAGAGRRGSFTIDLGGPRGSPGNGSARLNGALRALIEAGIPLISVEAQSASLSDVFLALTAEADDGV